MAEVVADQRTPTPRLTARGAATSARIVAAAASLVYERGIAGTSLDDVRAATGTSKSQLYHYFADKDTLLHEVIKAQFGRIIAAAQATRSARPLELALNMALQHIAAYRRRPKQARQR